MSKESSLKTIEKNDSQLILLNGSNGYYLENSDYKNDNSKDPDEFRSEKNDPVQRVLQALLVGKKSK